jgi:hypothetical protein
MSIAYDTTQRSPGRWKELETRRGVRMLVVMLLGLVAVAVRVPGALGGLWRDEVQSHLISSLPGLGEMLTFLIETESHPPLYYLVLRALGPGAPDWLLTLPSLVFSFALVFAVYFAGRRMFGLRTAVWAAVGTAFYPVLVAYGSAARPYALLALLNVLAVYVAWEAFERRNSAHWLLYGVMAALLLYTHTWALILVTAQGLALLGLAAVRKTVRATLTGAAKAAFVVLVLWGPWIPSLLKQIDQGGHGKLYLALGELLTLWVQVSLGGLMSFGFGITGPLSSLAPGPVRLLIGALWLGLVGFFLYHAGRRLKVADASEADAGFFLITTILAAATLAFALTPVSNLLVLHPMTALAPLVVLLLAQGLTAARAPAATWIFLVVVLAGASLQLWDRSNAPKAAAFIAAEMPADADLLVLPESYLSSLARYDAGLAARSPRTFPAHEVGRPVNYRDRWARFADTDAFEAFRATAVAALEEGREVWLVTLLTDTVEGVPREGDFDIVPVRIHELDRSLTDAAATVDTMRPGFGRVENQVIVRYVPVLSPDRALSAKPGTGSELAEWSSGAAASAGGPE